MSEQAAESELILFHGWSSSASRKVRFALSEKGLAYESRPMNIRKNEHHSAAYRKIQPNAVVPALIHAGRTIIESSLINEYLDDRFPHPALRPSDPYQRYRMRLWCRDVDEKYLPAILKHNWMLATHPIARNWSDAELEEKLRNIPNPERRHFWYRMARDPFTPAELEEAMAVLLGMISDMEAALVSADWLCGDAFSLADLSVTPYVKRVCELRPEALAPASRPRVADWWRRIEARPGYRGAHIGSFMEQSAADYQGPALAGSGP